MLETLSQPPSSLRRLVRPTAISLLLTALYSAAGATDGNYKDQPYRWQSVKIVAGGFISGIDFHPNQKDLSYVRTDIGGAYRWDAATGRWVPLLDWLTNEDWNLYGLESIGLDPSDPNKLYLACGTYTNEWGGNGAILRSSDQGRTFARTDLPFKLGGNEDGRSIGERLAVDPNQGSILFFGTRHNGLWTSRDAGATWGQVPTFPITSRTNGIGTCVVTFDPSSGSPGHPSKKIYVSEASLSANLYRTVDGGTTWEEVPGHPKGMYPHQMRMTSTGTLVITFSNGPGPNGVTNGAVWTLDTRTGSWADITPLRPNLAGQHEYGYAGLAIDPRNPKTVIVSTMDRWNGGDDVFRTTDGGKTWTSLKSGSVRDASAAPYMTWGNDTASFGWWIGAVGLDPFRPSTVLYGTGANIWGSDDTDLAATSGVSHWNVRGLGIEETADIELLSPATGPHLISGLGDIGGFTHLDLNKPAPGMTLHPQLGNVDSIDSAGEASNWVVRVGRGNADHATGGYSSNAGVTWSEFPTSPSKRAESGSVAISANGNTILWAPNDQSPFVTTDLGKSWIASKGVPNRAFVLSDRVSPTTYYAISGSQVLISNDSGLTFERQNTLGLDGEHERLRATPGRKGDLWAPSKNGLARSLDGGKTFIAVPGVNAAQSVGFGKAAPGRDFPAVFINGKVSGKSGVFRSDDAGKTWVRITDAQHEYGVRNIVTGDPRIYGRVYLGTNGRGVLYGDPK